MATRGRKTKRTPETEKRILDALRVGASRQDAFESAGIGERTFYDWMEGFPQFSQLVSHAEAACAVRMSARIYQEATTDKGEWKSALEWLKRRRRNEWGDNVTVRADEEARRIIAEMFPESAAGGTRASEN